MRKEKEDEVEEAQKKEFIKLVYGALLSNKCDLFVNFSEMKEQKFLSNFHQS